jgi:PAS domain S-box-containing protein
MILDTEDRYRRTLDSLLEGFQIITHDWTYLYVNPAAARHGRHSPDELHGRRMWEVYPGIEDTPLFVVLKRCMMARKATSLENLFTFPDHTTRWFEIRVEPVPEGICVHSVDIQDRKNAEVALREQESVATLGQMAAVVAHEVKNPLAGLSGVLHVLKGRRPAHDPEVPLFEEMLDCIKSLNRLIQDLLVFAKPIQIDTKPVSIAKVVRDALLFLENDPDLKRHSVKLSVEEPNPIVRADRELLTGVLRNLLLNAAQAMHEAGSIEVRVARDGRACRLAVADTGPGILPGLSSRIFEPFATGKKGGTGLGLSISRRIMRLHGGELELLSTAAPGATFLLTVPLHTET